jgi:hypothetical protein
MCFVWISERTAIISLYNVNCSIFIAEAGVFTARYGLNLELQFVLIFLFLDG